MPDDGESYYWDEDTPWPQGFEPEAAGVIFQD